MILNKYSQPKVILLALLFFLIILPIAILMRVLGKAPLNLAFNKKAKTYWVRRDPPGPDPQSMRSQF